MEFISTRSAKLRTNAAGAILHGLASDGGLFLPDEIPHFSLEEITSMASMPYGEIASKVLERFLPGFTGEELGSFADAAYRSFDDPAVTPLHALGGGLYTLELYHGPTCAFKDLALQMLPHLLTLSLEKSHPGATALILTATSGDTGKAALEGFRDVPGVRILVFYPQNGVSEMQKLQMITQEGDNVGVCAIEGNFDDAQTGVKKAFEEVNSSTEMTLIVDNQA